MDEILINDWHVVARSQDLKPGDVKQVKLLGEDIVIWRADSPEGQAFAWQDWCPHRGINLPLLPVDKHSSENTWPAEVHVPCDRGAIAYRRWLKKLGVTYGVC